ncbi:MAG TPA: hypothetical protein VL832_26110, partial [Puia sp.]|nr:hypothetical protein [Puia sp.]
QVLAASPAPYAAFEAMINPECSTNRRDRKTARLILRNQEKFETLYDCIWNDLSIEEQYVLYDFCLDSYTNYKNKAVLNSLMNKGILILRDDAFKPFSLSFRNYVLSKKHEESLNKFIIERSSGGNWASLRIPLLTIVAVVAIFTAYTQSDFTNQITAILTSLLALFPLLFKILENFGISLENKKK